MRNLRLVEETSQDQEPETDPFCETQKKIDELRIFQRQSNFEGTIHFVFGMIAVCGLYTLGIVDARMKYEERKKREVAQLVLSSECISKGELVRKIDQF